MRENRTTYAGTQPLNINSGPSFFNEFRITCIVELDPGPEAFIIRLCYRWRRVRLLNYVVLCCVVMSIVLCCVLYYVVYYDEYYVVFYMVWYNGMDQ